MTIQQSALIMRHKTLGELRTELRARLGFVTQGPSANQNRATMNSFLQEANHYVTTKLGPSSSRKRAIVTLEPGSILYDWHNDSEDEDIHPGTVLSVWLHRALADRQPLAQGITEAHRARAERSAPCRYDTTNGQCEVWPMPDKNYDLLIEYTGGMPRFTQDADRTAVDDRLVFLYALAVAKSHYRHPDAQAALSAFNSLMSIELSRQHENRRYLAGRASGAASTVMGEAGQYHFYPGGK